MKTFEVTVVRQEIISFALEATDAADAEARYLEDGDETGSVTVNITVKSVGEVTDDLE